MKKEAGYALLEVLLLSVFALTLIAASGAFTQTALLQQNDCKRAQAIYLLQEKFAFLEQQGEQRKLQAGSFYDGADNLASFHTTVMQAGEYQIYTNVAEGEDGIYPATITVTWQGGRGRQELTMQRKIVMHENDKKETKQ